MADLFEKVLIDRPIDDVFNTMANPENAAKMFANVTEVERTNDQEQQVGATYREYRQLTNRRVGTDIEITRYEQGKKYSFKSTSNGLTVEYGYTFDTEDGKTKVSFEGTVFPEKLMMKLTKPLVVRMLKKEDQDHLKYVKQYLENEQE
ncbi:hypothetical protein CR194_07525 [Salipaludibacillus keqinensis]|uniref:DUF3284 domain-containing protein n=1 Tax=Salipaludibacillus keqinensis TaxID=2045207 RepID=A0A323TEA2_9BACI|nr:SRPBCC family protein [Salipaludibacillus keqinensis]PYZ93040.1 hypothetical protein CR194_07525 [Salipaludibacillus keqinensis]